jgi:hypothetical protein
LSLDGAGYRSFISIILLDHILKMATFDPNNPEPPSPRPCEHFDLIGGTSSGGLLAIFFGVLRMSCQEVRVAYQKLGAALFVESNKYPGRAKPQNPTRAKFIQELEKIIEEKTGDRHALLSWRPAERREVSAVICHVGFFVVFWLPSLNAFAGVDQTFVTTMSTLIRSSAPYLLRSYPTPRGEVEIPSTGYKWTIKDAILATTADPELFHAFYVQGHGFREAGMLGFSNPAGLAHDEAFRLFPNKDMNVLVSLGAGLRVVPFPVGDPGVPGRWKLQLRTVASNPERLHEALSKTVDKL